MLLQISRRTIWWLMPSQRTHLWLVLIGLVSLVIACTSHKEEPAAPLPTSGLFVVLTVTPHPDPTSTPLPTATPEPTVTPEPVQVDWNKLADPPFGAHNLTVLSLDSGHVAVHVRGQIVLYDPVTDEWTVNKDQSVQVWRWVESPLGRLVVLGAGRMWYMNSDSARAEEGPALNSDKPIYWSLGTEDGRIFVNHGPDAEFDEMFDPETDSWVEVASAWSRDVSIAFTNGSIELGHDRYLSTESPRVWIFDLPTKSWTESAEPNEPRWKARLFKLPDNRVLLSGGVKQVGRAVPTDSIEVYDPAIDAWSFWPPASLLDHDLFMINSWIVDDIGTVLGEFISRSDSTRPTQLGYYDPDADNWAMIPLPSVFSVSRTIAPIDNRQILLINQNGYGDDAEVSAWTTILP